MEIAVSYLKSQVNKETTIKKIAASIADYIHVDLMDGLFVLENTGSIEDHLSILKKATKPLHVHLMVENPHDIITKIASLKPATIIIHKEIPNFLEEISHIKTLNIKAGLAINPETNIETIFPYLPKLDEVLVMSVHPGRGGQSFLPETIAKLKTLNKQKKDQNLAFKISIDGGINNETASLVKPYVNILISGSYVCMSDDYNKQIAKLKNS